MTEVVLCDRKTIFVKSRNFTVYILLFIACTIPSSLSSGSLPGLKSPDLDKYTSSIVKPSSSKFSSILLKNSPFRIPVHVPTSLNPAISTSNADSSNTLEKVGSASPHEIQGDSLWGVIKKSFLKQKNQQPNSFKNSVFASPSLKSPRQAWEDLVTNAKSGFKNRYSPFQQLKTLKSTSISKESNISNDNQDVLRSPRGSYFPIDTPGLLSDTLKVLWDVKDDVASHVLNKHVVHANVHPHVVHTKVHPHVAHPFSSIKNTILSHVEATLGFKDGVKQIYKNKAKDLAYHTFLHKESKLKFPSPIGWMRSALLGNGWGSSIFPIVPHETAVAHPPVPVIITDEPLIKHWIKATLNIKKQILLAKWYLTVELLNIIPFLGHITFKLVHAILWLIGHNQFTLAHKILHILYKLKKLKKSAWIGKNKFLSHFLTDDQPWYGPPLLAYPGKVIPYGVDLTTQPNNEYGAPEQVEYKKPNNEYGAPEQVEYKKPTNAYGGPTPEQIEYKKPSNVYGGPPPEQYEKPHYQAYEQQQIPPRDIVSKNPLYSYPSLYSGEVPPHKFDIVPLPPVATNSYGAEKEKLVDIPSYTVYNSPSHASHHRDSVGLGSENSDIQPSGFLSKLVQSLDSTIKNKRTEDKALQSETADKSTDGGSKFSLKLLNTGFNSR